VALYEDTSKPDAQEEGDPDEPTPRGWAAHWQPEIEAARAELKKWHKTGETVLKRFRDERGSSTNGDTRWNLYTTNVQTQRALLYGNVPKVSVDRRFADAKDSLARVAGEMLERLLNSDIARDTDGYSQALLAALDDRLQPGLGLVRVRYVVESETQETPAIAHPLTGEELAPAYSQEVKTREDVETDHVHWKDFLWSPCRSHNELRWIAFRAEMPRKELRRRFGDKVARRVPLNAKKDKDREKESPLARAEVWEIWSKEYRKVFWYVEGYDETLDVKADPLGLEGFWPCPRPMLANVTTSTMVPRPDFAIAQDLYDEIDTVSTRITLLERSIRVAGVYDKSAGALQRLVSEASQNELIPVENWAMFAEKGGIRGQVDWLPLDQISMALTALRDYRRELKDALYEITGMSDIMRGQGTDVGVTATEQAIKAKFGSVRIQALQDEFARFASDVQKLKAEIISKHFDVQTILERSNAQYTWDEGTAPQAAALIKSDLACYRIEVKPENLSLTDFAALKSERMEVMAGISTFLQAAAPIGQMVPASAPFLLQILQWAVSGLKGSSGIEGVLDQMILSAQQAQQQAASQPQAPTPPDPKVQAAQLKAQADLQKTQAELQADVIRSSVEVRAEEQKQQAQTEWNVREHVLKTQVDRAMKPMGPTGGPGSAKPLGGGA
jgi:tRNA U38,U39,U40 pseudouridine synthase TruA